MHPVGANTYFIFFSRNPRALVGGKNIKNAYTNSLFDVGATDFAWS